MVTMDREMKKRIESFLAKYPSELEFYKNKEFQYAHANYIGWICVKTQQRFDPWRWKIQKALVVVETERFGITAVVNNG